MKQTYLSLVNIILCYYDLSILLEDLCDDPSNRLTLRELFRQIMSVLIMPGFLNFPILLHNMIKFLLQFNVL